MNTLLAQHKPAYQLYKQKGKALDYGQVIKELKKADIVLFGELHNNPICHWLQLEMAHDLAKIHQQKLVLAAEMFEADDQLIINEYLAGDIKEKHLVAEAKVWNNYDTDYAPLMGLASEFNLNFVASNIPRRYANLVARKGLSALQELSQEALAYIAPLPIKVDLELPGYKNMLAMMKGHEGNKGENFASAQAIKDATMAHFILQNWEKGKHVLHFNGAYHSNNFEGIVWYLKQQNPKLKIVTISSVEQAAVSSLEEQYEQLADFILVIPKRMTKTY